MPAAVAIPLIIAGSSVAGAAISAHAAGKAADQQAAAGDKALGLQRDIYNQQSQALSPYIGLGYGAMDRYNQHYGGGMPTGGAMNGGGYNMPPGGFGLSNAAVPRVNAPMPQRAGLVRVQAPTGEVAMLPQVQAQRAVQMGARILDTGGPNPSIGQTHMPLSY